MRETMVERSRRALLRCDGGAGFGLGHLRRCLTLARRLSEHQAWGVAFALEGDEETAQMVGDHGYPLHMKPTDLDDDAWLAWVASEYKPDAIICDTRSSLSAQALAEIRDRGIITVVVDDSSDRRLVSDLSFYPPVPQVNWLDWGDASGEHLVGWDWVVLGAEPVRRTKTQTHGRSCVLVSMGGADPEGLTQEVMGALECVDEVFDTIVAIGPAFAQQDELVKRLSVSPVRPTVCRGIHAVATLMVRASLAVCTFGVTAYELAAMGVPAIHLCLDEDHMESASVFEAEGMAVSLDIGASLLGQDIAECVKELLGDRGRLERMSKIAAARVDGRGAERIVAMIDRLVTCRRNN